MMGKTKIPKKMAPPITPLMLRIRDTWMSGLKILMIVGESCVDDDSWAVSVFFDGDLLSCFAMESEYLLRLKR